MPQESDLLFLARRRSKLLRILFAANSAGRYLNHNGADLRAVGDRFVLVAFFSGVTTVITTILIPAYFGDNNPRWAKRLAAIAFVAAVLLLAAIFYGV